MNATTEFISHSQVGQDLWAWGRLGKPTIGHFTFMDMGAGDPVHYNNTVAFEDIGWRGWAIDSNPDLIPTWRPRRQTPLITYDASKIDWSIHGIPLLDYLSLDVDASTSDALKNLISKRVRFRVATIEHDSYRFGQGPRDEMRKLLTASGYALERADVSDQGLAFEDWWVDPKTV